MVTIPTDKLERINQDQTKSKRRVHLMKAELTTISPQSMLFNALNVASTELARLNRLSQTGDLSMADFKKYQILINSLVKLSEENRLSKSQSHLEGLSDDEVKAKVLEALGVLDE